MTDQPPYYSYEFQGDLNGPASSHTSYFTSLYNQKGINDSIVNAVVLDDGLKPGAVYPGHLKPEQ